MDKQLYKEKLDTTQATVILYYKLASLEYENKQNSEEYNDMIDLLKKMISIEHQMYNQGNYIPNAMAFYQDMMFSQSFENCYFLQPNIDNVTKIRFLNRSRINQLYTLNGIVNNQMAQHLQRSQDVSFFNELTAYLQHENVTELERKRLIDFKYALLAISNVVEKQFLTNKLFIPVTSKNMTKEELCMSEIYIYGKVNLIINLIDSSTDSELSEQLLPMILYVKSCLCMLKTNLVESILSKLEDMIELDRIMGYIDQQNRHQGLDMLYSIIHPKGYGKAIAKPNKV